ncbi:MAG: site-specific DNA-methyltransferase [Clostridia bacterium]|nr:site-specific DNA-methyltransferase [Clostridia bacterium]
MPTLEWIGKEKVINHHQQVPYRVLEERYTYNAESSENMIIRGDNLDALKALLPRFEGRIKCIYIDPPYNTGNEGWVYNDNVNDPKIRKWLGQVVGREGEDLSRHDKWLCMMYPRLKLLQKLLSDDGVIFISIDDTEYANLKLICDEIFGSNCFVSNISWQRTYSTRNDSKGIPAEVEHLLCYSKQSDWQPNKLPRTAEMDDRYSSPDNDPRPWKAGDASAPGASTHPGMVYAIQQPITGKLLYPPNGRCWTYGQEQMFSIMQGWAEYELRPLDDYEKRVEICGQSDTVPKEICAIMLKKTIAEVMPLTKERYNQGAWPVLYFTSKGKGGIACKRYLEEMGGRIATNYWPYDEVGHTDEAKKELISVFEGNSPFDTPKPSRLIERVLCVAGDNNAIILDSFAGSGTTAHAVLNMNKADGGNRRFILVEMMDYAESITAERVKRVIDGYGEGKNAVEGTGGDFTFYDLGQALLLPDGNLNEEVGVDKIRDYVWYMETRTPYAPVSNENEYYLGGNNGTDYYFYYEKERLTTLNHGFLSTIKQKAEGYLIYADLCTIPDEELKRYNITFKKIPRDIKRL